MKTVGTDALAGQRDRLNVRRRCGCRSCACTAPGFLDTRLLLSGGLHDRLVPGCSGITGTAQSVLFDEPLGVVAGDEVANGVADLVDGLVDSAMHDLLLQRA